MSARHEAYLAYRAAAKPSHRRVIKPWERMSEDERARFEPKKEAKPETKQAKGKAKKTAKKKATRKKATSKKK